LTKIIDVKLTVKDMKDLHFEPIAKRHLRIYEAVLEQCTGIANFPPPFTDEQKIALGSTIEQVFNNVVNAFEDGQEPEEMETA